MKQKIRSGILTVFLSFIVTLAGAQVKTYQGKVTDSDGETLPGVSIVIKGTHSGTVTNADGVYSIKAESGSTLVFSFVGMTSQELVLGNQSNEDVTLSTDAIGLDEFIAVGYGTQKRSDVTGSVTSVNVAEITQGAVVSVNEALQGRAAGVQVASSDGSPGGGVNIRIRGTSTINGKTEPLYVVDGLPINSSSEEQYVAGGIRESGEYNNNKPNPLSMINPNDIESIEILKDASATAIYGARGANGVVLIKTKRGKAGKTNISVDYTGGMQYIAKKYDRLTGPEYAERVNEAWRNGGYDGVKYDGSQWYYPVPENAPTTYWQDEIYRPAEMQDITTSLTGGTETTQYALSFNLFDQEGIINNSDYNRFSTRLNLDQSFGKVVKIGTSLNFVREGQNQAPTDGINVVADALNHNPAEEIDWMREGRWYVDPENVYGSTNPVKLLERNKDETTTNRFIGNVYLDVNIMPELKWHTSIGTDYSFAERLNYLDRTLYISEAIYPGGQASIRQNMANLMMSNSYLSWNKELGQHTVSAIAGAEVQQFVRETRYMQDELFATDATGWDAIGSGAGTKRVGTNKSQWQTVGFFGRLNYDYEGKYLMTANFRYDGSSRFGAGNKWGFFPSVALGWRVTEEDFMQDIDFISNLKLRTSYGLTGNGDIPVYSSLGTWGINGNQYSYNQNVVSGAYLGRLENPDLKWETTKQFNVGADFAVLNNRLGVVLDYFRKNTEDLILNISIPKTSGFTSSRQNIGSMLNQGYEFTLYGVPVKSRDFAWDMNFNVTVLRSEVTDIGDDAFLDIAALNRRPGMRLEVGKPAGMIRGYIKEGTFATQAEADAAPYHGAGKNVAGYYKYKDTNGDNKIDANDMVPIGNGQPDFIYGFSNTLTYKSFDLYMFFQGSYGNEIAMFYSTTSPYEVMENEWTSDDPYDKRYAINRRGGNGDIGFFSNDTYNVWDGSYIRLKTLRLGYNLPTKNIDWIGKARITLSADNLFTLTEYPGYNPDVSSGGNTAFGEGWDAGAYPMARVFKLGVNLTF